MSESTVKERLKIFIKHKNLNNSKFCRTIGVSNAFISSMRKSIQPDKVESIAFNYPDLNIEWLLTGIGDMIKVNSMVSSVQEKPPEYSGCLKCSEKDRVINSLTAYIRVLESRIVELEDKQNLKQKAS